MVGKRLLINLLLVIFLMPTAEVRADGGMVAVLLSDDVVAYHRVVEYFRTALELPVSVYNLNGDVEQAPAVMKKMAADKPRLILALGSKAAFISKMWTEDSQQPPVLFALVLNWQRYGLLESANMAGISAEVAPGTQLANILMFVPSIKRIGVIYNRSLRPT